MTFSATIHRTVRVAPITVQRSGRRGRPRKVINKAWLEDAVSARRNITLTSIAEKLGTHRNSVRQQLAHHGVWKKFTEISDDDLDKMIRVFKSTKPASGMRYVVGFLRSHGVRVQRSRVERAMRSVDRLGMVLRRQERIPRGRYTVPRPNHMWHLDGHHKLIQWGIVIHGMVDGYCRTVSSTRYGSITNGITH